MRRPLVIYDFATAPFWISSYSIRGKFDFLFYQWFFYIKFGDDRTRNKIVPYNNHAFAIVFDNEMDVENTFYYFCFNLICKTKRIPLPLPIPNKWQNYMTTCSNPLSMNQMCHHREFVNIYLYIILNFFPRPWNA